MTARPPPRRPLNFNATKRTYQRRDVPIRTLFPKLTSSISFFSFIQLRSVLLRETYSFDCVSMLTATSFHQL